MALVLAVYENDQIFVDDDCLTILKVYKSGGCKLEVHGKIIVIDDTQSIEVLPEVLLSAGIAPVNTLQSRLVFSAPRKKIILRGDMYRAGKPNVSD